MSRLKIAHRVAYRYFKTARQVTYALTPAVLEMAQALSFVDETNMNVKMGLACKLASDAEDIVEAGGIYRASIQVQYYPDPIGRANAMLDLGLEAMTEDLLKSSLLRKYFNQGLKTLRPHEMTRAERDQLSSQDLSSIGSVYRSAIEAFMDNRSRLRIEQLGWDRLSELVIGILRDLDIEASKETVVVDVQMLQTRSPFFASIVVDGKTFFEGDPLDFTPQLIGESEQLAADSYYTSAGTDAFEGLLGGTMQLDGLAMDMTNLSAALNHKSAEVKAQAEAWVSSQLVEYMRDCVVYSKGDVPLIASARGLQKRMVKHWDSTAKVGITGQEVKKVLAKDFKMLVDKAWKKSSLKNNFGPLKIDPRLVDYLFECLAPYMDPDKWRLRFLEESKPQRAIKAFVFFALADAAASTMLKPPRAQYDKALARFIL